MLAWLSVHATVLTLLTNVVLVAVTSVYVYLTQRILRTAQTTSRLSLNPVIGIEVRDAHISPVWGERKRRNMSVALQLTNVGNAPAIELLVDGEIVLQYSKVSGSSSIPSRFEPSMVSFLEPGKSVADDSLCFGNKLIVHLFDDFREFQRLNAHRIATNPSQEAFQASRLRIIVSYRNSIGQHYQSVYTVYVHLGASPQVTIPADDEDVELTFLNYPRPTFHAQPVGADWLADDVHSRDVLRDACGW